MAKVNKDVSGPSVPCTVDEQVLSAPFVCVLSLLGENTMKDNEDEQPHQNESNVGVRISKEEDVSKGVPCPVACSKVKNEDESTANRVDPEEPAPHVSINMTVNNNHEGSEEAPGSSCYTSMGLLAPNISIDPVAIVVGLR